MNRTEALGQVDNIVSKLPVEFPRQVYLRKGSVYVESYDPVYDIEVLDDSVKVIGYLHQEYEHSFDEFDRIYITDAEEPVVVSDE